jgi:hypothetical protein
MTGADLDQEEHVQTAHGHRAVDMEEVARQHRRGLGTQELPPGRAAALRRGRDPQPPQYPPHRRRPDLVAEAEQLALDPLVAPARVLPRHLHGQCHQPGVDWRPSCPGRIGPPPADQPPVPAQQRVRRDQPAPPHRPGQQAGQGGEHRAAGPVQPRLRVLPPQHRDLMAQHQQFGVLRRRRACQQRHPARQADERQVDHPYHHEPAMLPAARPAPQVNRQVKTAYIPFWETNSVCSTSWCSWNAAWTPLSLNRRCRPADESRTPRTPRPPGRLRTGRAGADACAGRGAKEPAAAHRGLVKRTHHNKSPSWASPQPDKACSFQVDVGERGSGQSWTLTRCVTSMTA